MDNSLVDSQIRANKVKEGVLDKRSQFLKEWRDRWVVLTTNYLFTFKSKVYVDPTDILDLRTVKSIKSYLKKYEDRESCAFKIASEDSSMYFRCRGATEKWSWIVALERVMDYRNYGKSSYNDADAVRNKGFDAVSLSQPGSPTKSPEKKEESKKDQPKKEEQKKEQPKKEEPKKEEPKKEEPKVEPPKQQQKKIEQQKKPEEQPKETVIKVQKAEEPKKQEPPKEPPKKEEPKKQEPKVEQPNPKTEAPKEQTSPTKPQQTTEQTTSISVAQRKQMYEKQGEGRPVSIAVPSPTRKPDEPMSIENQNHVRRGQIVSGIFGELETKNIESFQGCLNFLVGMCSSEANKFREYVLYYVKSHKMRKAFAQLFVETYTEQITNQQAFAMLKFINAAYYDCPDLFNPNQLNIMKKLMIKFVSTYKDEETLNHAIKNYLMLVGPNNNPDIELVKSVKEILDELEKSAKNLDLRGNARKLREAAKL